MNKKINYPNGDCYEGEVNERGLPHGNGVMVYCGDCENDLPYGKGKLTNYSSVTDMTYDGEWKDGLRHGFGEYTLSWDKGTFPPQRYEGEWKDDKRCGKEICWYGRNKDKMYEGDWLNDKREGHGIRKYENGDVVECGWKSGDKNGEGIFTFDDFPSHRSGLPR